MTPAPVSPSRGRTAALAALLAVGLLAAPIPALADAADDPDLDQSLDELAIVHGQRVLEAGHVDMGPKYEDDGTWRFLIHDDVAKADANAESVWRYPDETVFHVLDEAMLTVPDDPAYEFLGAAAGAEVYVVPQTQNPQVVWVGWNTQDPTVMETIDRGITLSLDALQGPGTMTTYLQSGSFGEPQLLWDSRTAGAQPIWVDVNTHTHANWVFTEPGVYLVELTAEADLIDGTHVSDTQRIRFAVGTATSSEEALAAAWDGDDTQQEGAQDAVTQGAEATQDAGAQPADSPLVPILIGAIVLVAIGLVTGFAIAIVRGDRARRRILESRRRTGPDAVDAPADGDRT
jgi:surface-anchored protein